MNKNLLFAAAMAMTATTAMAQKLKYPEAPHDNTVDTYFGEKVADPFRPLEDDNSEANAKWVKEENALTRSYLDKMPQRTATLQQDQAGSAPVLIRIDSKAGHGGGKPLSKQMEENADIYGFIMYQMGMKVK